MTTHTTLAVALGDRTYPIHIGSGLLANSALITPHLGTHAVLISNVIVAPLYAARLTEALRAAGISVIEVTLADGEVYKSQETLYSIYDALLVHRADRATTLIALGGGVIGDLAGFAAATYQRGVPFVQIPTTLLAQVDSSVGGKTGVNHRLGKNMIGAFHQPRAVIIDTDTLNTLPDREYLAGLAEVIKYGIALDAAFFDWLEANIGALRRRDPRALAYAIERSCAIKARVVADDERETATDGGRALLNFGHTFGHAIEAGLGYGVWLHGEAVGCGMALATEFSVSHGCLDPRSADRVLALIAATGLPMSCPAISATTMLEHMGRDKKNQSGAIRLIALDAIGVARIDGAHSAAAICRFLESPQPTSRG